MDDETEEGFASPSDVKDLLASTESVSFTNDELFDSEASKPDDLSVAVANEGTGAGRCVSGFNKTTEKYKSFNVPNFLSILDPHGH